MTQPAPITSAPKTPQKHPRCLRAARTTSIALATLLTLGTLFSVLAYKGVFGPNPFKNALPPALMGGGSAISIVLSVLFRCLSLHKPDGARPLNTPKIATQDVTEPDVRMQTAPLAPDMCLGIYTEAFDRVVGEGEAMYDTPDLEERTHIYYRENGELHEVVLIEDGLSPWTMINTPDLARFELSPDHILPKLPQNVYSQHVAWTQLLGEGFGVQGQVGDIHFLLASGSAPRYFCHEYSPAFLRTSFNIDPEAFEVFDAGGTHWVWRCGQVFSLRGGRIVVVTEEFNTSMMRVLTQADDEDAYEVHKYGETGVYAFRRGVFPRTQTSFYLRDDLLQAVHTFLASSWGRRNAPTVEDLDKEIL